MILFSPIIFIIRNRSSHYFIPRIEYSPYRFPSLTLFIIFIIHIAILAILVKDSIRTTPILQFPRSIDFQRQSNIPSRLSRFKKSDVKKKRFPQFPNLPTTDNVEKAQFSEHTAEIKIHVRASGIAGDGSRKSKSESRGRRVDPGATTGCPEPGHRSL